MHFAIKTHQAKELEFQMARLVWYLSWRIRIHQPRTVENKHFHLASNFFHYLPALCSWAAQ